MSHPPVWPKKSDFQPIGRTPPVAFTDHLPPEGDATILLLGCGDPRSILYTITVDHGFPCRSMDFTCCDSEPAIIARNALLFTLIYDNVEHDRLLRYWSIFYDLFLDKRGVSLLSEQCTKLVEYAADLATWNDSPYGSFLHFATQDSLNEVRRHWKSYEETVSLSNVKQKQLKQMFFDRMKAKAKPDIHGNTLSVPSAVPLTRQYAKYKTYSKYWSTGITNPTTEPKAARVNPTFLFSMNGRHLHLHPETDLCSSFHLALTQVKHVLNGSPVSTLPKTEHEIWRACGLQFTWWAKAFHGRIRGSNSGIIIRFVVGDALAVCEGLQMCRTSDFTPTIYSSGWGAKKLHFVDQSLPTSFDVIDTSSLSGNLGLFNVLIATIPLLRRSPCTILHTTSPISYKDHPTKMAAIEDRTLLDLPSIALLLGIVPICYSSGLTFRNGREIAIVPSVSGRHLERISWRFSQFALTNADGNSIKLDHGVHLEPEDFADKLLSLYLKMFEDENLKQRLRWSSSKHPWEIENTHYHRRSFVHFLWTVRSLGFVETDWQQTLGQFSRRVASNKDLAINRDNWDALFTQLYVWGLYSQSSYLPGYVVEKYGKPGVFSTWETIPPVVCLVLKVPRSELRMLEDMDDDEIGQPLLECETFKRDALYHDIWHNYHSSLRPIFGDIIDSPSDPGKKVIIEDDQGLDGRSPLIVSFYISSCTVAKDFHEATVSLSIKGTPSAYYTFRKSAFNRDMALRLYSTDMSDRNYVFILPEHPDNPREFLRMKAMNPILPEKQIPEKQRNIAVTTATFGKKPGRELLSQRLDVTVPHVKEALANNTSVEVKQVTSTCMEIVIGERDRYPLFYPFAVDGTRSKTRIARKSFYIEVILPLLHSPSVRAMLQPFPVVQYSEGQRHGPVSWNAPYVKLECLPMLSKGDTTEIYQMGTSRLVSEEERLPPGRPLPPTNTPAMNFKLAIRNALLTYDQGGSPVHLFRERTSPDPFAIVFLSSICLDVTSAGVVGDAVVVFVESGMERLMKQCLLGTAASNTIIHGDEILLWRRALPVFAERCRQWKHMPTCEYVKKGRIPLSFERGQNPMCSCGRGKNLGAFAENSRWKALVPYATRIAFAHVFLVPYLDDVEEEEKGRSGSASKSGGNISTGGVSSSSPPPRPPSPSPTLASAQNQGCEICRKVGDGQLLKCSACQSVRYCSTECQLADWKKHKVMCKRLRKGTS